jgi:hypothetical protein
MSELIKYEKYKISKLAVEKLDYGCTKGTKDEHQGKFIVTDVSIELKCSMCGNSFFFTRE